MITYALSAGSFGRQVTPATASAIRQSKFRNFEPYLGFFAEENESVRESEQLIRELIRDGVFRTASMHRPYSGNLYWDPSAADETVRRDVSGRLIALIRKYADLMGPMATLHASYGGIPASEHPQRIGQVCKTIEELLPVARELGFVINEEYLPRECVGNSEAELRQIISNFDPNQVGICMDVNHIMGKYRELPAMIDRLVLSGATLTAKDVELWVSGYEAPARVPERNLVELRRTCLPLPHPDGFPLNLRIW